MLSWLYWQGDLEEFMANHLASSHSNFRPVLLISNGKARSWDVSVEFVGGEPRSPPPHKVLSELCELLLSVSREWRYQISYAWHESGKILLNLHRLGVTIGAIQTISNIPGDLPVRQPVTLLLDPAVSDSAEASLTSARLRLVHDVTSRLLVFTGHDVTHIPSGGARVTHGDVRTHSDVRETTSASDLDNANGRCIIAFTTNPRFSVSSVSAASPDLTAEEACCESDSRCGEAEALAQLRAVNVVVAPVVNATTGKKDTDVSPAEYHRRRRARLEGAWRSRQRGPPQQVTEMARAAVAHELLSVSTSSPCRVATAEGAPVASSAERAVFALYNYARLRTILDRFKEEVAAGTYPALPEVAQLGHEFQLLSSPEEWTLVWSHLLPFPSLLEQCAAGVRRGRSDLHRLCEFLSSLSGAFSRYYSRTQILTPPREHLVATVHVRIHLLLAVESVFRHCFHLLGYQPPNRM